MECPLRGPCDASKACGRASGPAAYRPLPNARWGPEADLLIVAEYPSPDDDAGGMALQSHDGVRLVSYLKQAGIDPRRCYVTYAARCATYRGDKPGEAETNACRPWLLEVLGAQQWAAVLPFGNRALRSVMPETKWSAADIHGQPLVDSAGRVVFPLLSLNAAAVSAQPEEQIRRDLARFKTLSDEGRLRQEPDLPAYPTYGWAHGQFEELRRKLEELSTYTGLLAYDTETNGLDMYRRNARVETIAFSTAPGTGFAYAYHHDAAVWSSEEFAEIQRLTKAVLENPRSTKVGHNLGFDVLQAWRVLRCEVRGPWIDTMLAAHLLCGGLRTGSLSLKAQCYEHDTGMGGYEKGLDDWKDEHWQPEWGPGEYGRFPIRMLLSYNAADVDATLRVLYSQARRLRAEGMMNLFVEHTMPTLKAVIDMQDAGVTLSDGALAELLLELPDRYELALEELRRLPVVAEWERIQFQLRGEPVEFNPGSPQQMVAMLFEHMKLRPVGYTKSTRNLPDHLRVPSTDKNALSELRQRNPEHMAFFDGVSEYRKLKKLDSMLWSLREQVSHDGLIHTTYQPWGTDTGRLSCLPLGTPIITDRGIKAIETVTPGDRVVGRFGWSMVQASFPSGEEKTSVTVEAENGVRLTTSPEHRYLVDGKWKRAEQLKVGDRVTLASAPPSEPAVLDRTAEALGFFIAEGCISAHPNGRHYQAVLAFHPEEEAAYVRQRVLPALHAITGKTWTVSESEGRATLSGKAAVRKLIGLGLLGKSHERRAPACVMGGTPGRVAGFLRGLFQGDGHVIKASGAPALTTTSRGLADDVLVMLSSLGIRAAVYKKGRPAKRAHNQAWSVRVRSCSAALFLHSVGMGTTRKNKLLRCTPAHSKSLYPDAYVDMGALREVLPRAGGRWKEAFRQQPGRRVSDAALRELVAWGEAHPYVLLPEELLCAVRSGWEQRKIVSITRCSRRQPMWDLSVDGEAFAAGAGVVVHNSRDPNLLNIPSRGPLAKRAKSIFTTRWWAPRWDDELQASIRTPVGQQVSFDLSQIEPRVVAALSGDPYMVELYADLDGDIHKLNASLLFDVPYAQVTPELRQAGKTIGLALLYGTQAKHLAEILTTAYYEMGKPRLVTAEEAQLLIDRYWSRLEGVYRFKIACEQEAMRTGCVRTAFGRIRYIPGANDTNDRKRAEALRQAVNTKVQSVASDILLAAIPRVLDRFKAEGLRSRLVLTVYDSLTADAPDEEVETVKRIMREELTDTSRLPFMGRVPVKADCEVSRTWGGDESALMTHPEPMVHREMA